jgi:hypothetical protein
MEATRDLPPGDAATQAAKEAINAANLEALSREIRAARQLSAGRGLLAINVMRAVGEYAPSVKRALECGIDAVVVGAGLPLDLPELAQDHPDALLVPILSDARGVQLLVRKWERKKRLPDAIVIETRAWPAATLARPGSPTSAMPASKTSRGCSRWARPRCNSARPSPSRRSAMPTPTSSACWPRHATRTWWSSPASPACPPAPSPRGG